MPHQFHLELQELKTNLIRMASIVDDQIQKSVTSLISGDLSLYKEIKSKDDEVDAYDELLQVQCENILALHQPTAYDLRLVLSTLMINNQLERCGDLAVSIASRAKKIKDYHELVTESGIDEMGFEAQKMISRSIDSFIHLNNELAEHVIKNDDKVDVLNKHLFVFITKKMKDNPELIEPLAHLLILARQLERLADHATNISENLLFLIEAKIVTHRKLIEESK